MEIPILTPLLDSIEEWNPDRLELVSVSGSGGGNKNDRSKLSDWDLVTVTDNPPEYDPLNFGVYRGLTEIFRDIVDKSPIPIGVFPTFRLEMFVDDLIDNGSERRLLHWLHYPTPYELRWREPPELSRGLIQNGVPVAERQGFRYQLLAYLSEDEVLKPTGYEGMLDIEKILMDETFRLITGNTRLPESLLQKEGFHKLSYAIRWGVTKFLEQNGIDARNWSSIIRNYDTLPTKYQGLVEEIYGIRRSGELPTLDYITDLFERGYQFLNDLIVQDRRLRQ